MKFSNIVSMDDNSNPLIYETDLRSPDTKTLNELVFNTTLLKAASYGSSGFRKNISSQDMIPILHKCTLFSYKQSIINYKIVKKGKEFFYCPLATGIIITASHNPIYDNGIKLIAPNGMLFNENEIKQCEDFVNKKIKSFSDSELGVLLIFRDTRPHGKLLFNEIQNIAKLVNCKIIDCGVVSTPLANFVVYEFNRELNILNKLTYKTDKSLKYEGLEIKIPSYQKIKQKYFKIMSDFITTFPTVKPIKLYYDSANGVSKHIAERLNRTLAQDFMIHITPPGVLNENCGAEFLKLYGLHHTFSFTNQKDEILASFDGDMDRIVLLKENHVFDGDDLIINFGEFILNTFYENKIDATVVFIISHYTNLGCVKYLENLKKTFDMKPECRLQIKITIANTGITNFVTESLKYDASIYFEPNGHGGVIFSDRLKKDLSEETDDENLLIIKKSMDIFYPLVGDPLAVLLFSLNIGGPIIKFEKTPSLLLNIKFEEYQEEIMLNKLNEHVEYFESYRCYCPDCLENVDKGVNDTVFKNRIFIRPSGTEPVIRIFIEGTCKKNIEALGKEIEELCFKEDQNFYLF